MLKRKLQGDKIFAIGIGGGVQHQQQLTLAGDPKRVYDIASADALNADFKQIITKDVCEGAVTKEAPGEKFSIFFLLSC